MKVSNPINPALAIDFYDLYNIDGLQKIDAEFYKFFFTKNPELYHNFLLLRKDQNSFSKKQKDVILIDTARVLEDFLVYLFNIEKENFALKNEHVILQKIYFVKREFIQRIVAKKFKEEPQNLDIASIASGLKIAEKNITELEKNFAEKIFSLLQKENLNEKEQKIFEDLALYAAWALHSDDGKKLHEEGALFKLPKKIDHQKLFDFIDDNGSYSIKHSNNYQRDGFNLTDKGFNLNQTLSEAHYCIFCHKQDKDSCRTGIKPAKEKTTIDDNLEKKSDTKSAEGFFKYDPLGLELHGCPLDQKISEMNLLKSEGFSIASLAVAAIDNPLLAGTGHRICNDCMKACIFQKQDPVNIPQIESENLKDVLKLPYGFEIYSLLTRWNPLNLLQSLAQKDSGKKILIAGLGPAGYTLAHYLLNDGHNVVAIDGLKIEPLDPEISGIDHFGIRKKFKPIKFLDQIYEPLSSRAIHGFGGVAEYGITVRFDKNFLKIIRLLLERRENFRMFGGIRFGSSITDKIAFDEYGFDHVALCIGAGRPNIINIKNNYAKGIRSASDFLMSLQLSGAFKENLFTNLQIRMPIFVIGGGLTAVDTACEAQEYYFTQIKKFAQQYKKLTEVFGKEKILAQLNEEEKNIAKEFLQHNDEVNKNGREAFLQKINSVKILYRKKIQDAPSYKLNHQELEAAMKEGVEFISNANPSEAILDDFGYIKAIKCEDGREFNCKTLLIAAGTTPNISPALEDNLDFVLQGKYLAAIDKNGRKIDITHSAKPLDFSVFTKIDEKKRAVSFFGDLHPNFEGNVVKAMSSAKKGHKMISDLLAERQIQNVASSNITTDFVSAIKNILWRSQNNFNQKINHDFLVKIKQINQLSEHVVQVLVHAPLLAKQTKIGQIFRLQNYHFFAKKIDNYLLAMEGVPITALSSDPVSGVISGIVTLYGASTNLIKNFKKDEPCIFMGPSGKPTEIPKNETVLLIGGGRGNMPLRSIAKACKENGCKIIFVSGYRKESYIFKQKEKEKCSDVLIISIEESVNKKIVQRPQDQQYQGNVTDAIIKYFSTNNEKIDRIFALGGDKMMSALAKLRQDNLLPNFSSAPIAIASLNAPMQCMLKGVCSQCLQKRKNNNGEWEYFYSCANQDQDMDKIDFWHLKNRCEQNSLQEKITKLWLDCIRC